MEISEEVTKAAEEMHQCSDFLQNTKIRSDIAIHYSSLAERTYQFSPMLKGFNYRVELVEKFHSAFKHYNVDLIETDHPLEGYRVLFSPFLAHIDSETERRIKDWVEAGGVWIVGPMSDIMTSCGSKYTNAPFSFLEEYAGIYTKYQKPIANDVFRAVWNDGEGETLCDYYDAYEPTDSVPVIRYDGDEFGGYAVATERRIGRGRVIALGSVISHKGLRRLAGLAPIAEASDNVRLVRRSGNENGLIAVEQKNQAGYVILDGEYLDLIHGQALSGRREIAPYEVLVLKKL
jgi:beta-galactosidase